ncbi:hypothetical protein GM50_23410, partial [freshwater metagenome]
MLKSSRDICEDKRIVKAITLVRHRVLDVVQMHP